MDGGDFQLFREPAGADWPANVYDRVLGSRSLETLIALSVLVAFLYGCMGILNFVRGCVMGRVGARFQARLDRRVFFAVLKATTLNRATREASTGLHDLEAVQRLITSPALMALFDLPFAPLFFLGIFVFHPMMGIRPHSRPQPDGLPVKTACRLFRQSIPRAVIAHHPIAH